jgi:hypothetical protein
MKKTVASVALHFSYGAMAIIIWITKPPASHIRHPPYTPEAKLKGIRYISEQSKLLIERMSAVGVRPAQLGVLLEMLDDADGTYQSATVRN